MARYPDLAVRFVADLRPELARAQAERYGVPGHGSPDEALARDDVELIVNLTIPAAHAEVAAAALAAGKHVFDEKPIAFDLASAEALLTQADAAGLGVGCAPTSLGPGCRRRGGGSSAARSAFRSRRRRSSRTPGRTAGTRNPSSFTSPARGRCPPRPYLPRRARPGLGPVARVAAAAPAPRRPGSSEPDHAPARRSPSWCRPMWWPTTTSRPRRRPGDVQLRLDDSTGRGSSRSRGRRRPGRTRSEHVHRRGPIHRGEHDVETVRAAGREGGRDRGRRHGARHPRRRPAPRRREAWPACARRDARDGGLDRDRGVRRRREPVRAGVALPEDWDPAERTL